MLGMKSKFNRSNGFRINLHVLEGNSSWYVNPSTFYVNENTISQEDAARNLFHLESLRQQLDEGKGLYCPYNELSTCKCSPPWKEALLRILQWAREGKFGRSGEWRDLPPECTSRN
jgi:hypothetical protein